MGPTKKINTIELGKANILQLKKSSKVAILSFGSLLDISKKVADEMDATLVDMRFAKPLDERLLEELSISHDLFVTVEENVIAGGAGSAVNEFVNANSLSVKLLNFGIPDEFPVVGSPEDQKEAAQLTKENLLTKIESKLAKL